MVMQQGNFRQSGYLVIILSALFLITVPLHAQTDKKAGGHLYLSWGYNTERYTRSAIRISQPGYGNDYAFMNVKGHDHRGWDEALFTKQLTIPQYNLRLGYFFDKKKNLGVEINFDHTKFIFADRQRVHIKGTMNKKPYDGYALFKQDDTPGADSNSYYYLNNGANFLLFNIVQRLHLLSDKKKIVQLDGLVKFGLGPVIPHVQDKFFNQPQNKPHFQFGGWNTGTEVALRSTFVQHVYLELAGKLDYARYSNLKIYEGTARQAFGTAEVIMNLGICL